MRFYRYASCMSLVAAVLLAGCAAGPAPWYVSPYGPAYGHTTDPLAAPVARSSQGSAPAYPNVMHLCASQGLATDLVTSSCITPGGGRASRYDFYAPLMSPYPPPDPGDAIMACGGRAVDFVTGQCF